MDTPYLPLTFHDTAKQIHTTAVDHGFWTEDRNFGEMIALMHSELSEALECHREDEPVVYYKHHLECYISLCEDACVSTTERTPINCTCNPKPEGAAVELVDAMIRELDTLYKILEDTGYTIDDVLLLKMEYNKTRQHMHGKAY